MYGRRDILVNPGDQSYGAGNIVPSSWEKTVDSTQLTASSLTSFQLFVSFASDTVQYHSIASPEMHPLVQCHCRHSRSEIVSPTRFHVDLSRFTDADGGSWSSSCLPYLRSRPVLYLDATGCSRNPVSLAPLHILSELENDIIFPCSVSTPSPSSPIRLLTSYTP